MAGLWPFRHALATASMILSTFSTILFHLRVEAPALFCGEFSSRSRAGSRRAYSTALVSLFLLTEGSFEVVITMLIALPQMPPSVPHRIAEAPSIQSRTGDYFTLRPRSRSQDDARP